MSLFSSSFNTPEENSKKENEMLGKKKKEKKESFLDAYARIQAKTIAQDPFFEWENMQETKQDTSLIDTKEKPNETQADEKRNENKINQILTLKLFGFSCLIFSIVINLAFILILPIILKCIFILLKGQPEMAKYEEYLPTNYLTLLCFVIIVRLLFFISDL